MKKINEVKKILNYIGYYHNRDGFSIENVYKGNITGIRFNEDESELTLTCLRPGIVIGKGGENFDWIQSSIVKIIGPVKVLIEEDKFWEINYGKDLEVN
mgnify:CR=1 FL=1